MSIYSLIPDDRFITRPELVRLTGWSDRKVRDEISRLRKNPDTVIISSSRSKGYKRPESAEEIRLYMYECKSRIKDEQETVDALEKAISRMASVRRTQQLEFDF